MKRVNLLILKLIVLVTSPCLAFQIETEIKDSVEIEADLLPAKNHFLVRGKINGKKAYFLLDTGSSYTVLHCKAARQYDFQLFQTKNANQISAGVNSSRNLERSTAINVVLDLGQPSFKQSYICSKPHSGN